MKHCIKKSIVILGLIYFSAPLAYASWPAFAAPDADFLVRNNYVTTAGCPVGQGKLLSNAMINIHANLCKTFCPEDWTWVAQSDDQCHDLKSGFQFKQFDIEHITDENGATSYSVVRASYTDATGNSSNKFVLSTRPNEYWHCVVMNADLHFIMCANDT